MSRSTRRDAKLDAEFSEFVAARSPQLYRSAYLLTMSPHSAEDLVQTALAKTYAAWWRVRSAHDPVAYVHEVMGKRDAATLRAFQTVAAALGRGTGALVNLHDPDVVTLGGIAALIRAAAPGNFEDAYRAGLMAFRKDTPPPVRDAQHGEDGPLYGAVALALDHVTAPPGLMDWVERQHG